MSSKTETVQSFARGLDVLRSFGGERRRQTITDVAERTGMTRAAARRFLYTLCEQGFARTDGKYFELTPAVLEISHAYLSSVSELESIRDILHDLTRELDESASAAMLDGSDIIYVARSPARHRIMTIGLAVGTRLPAHATSMGQILLAQLSHNELERFFSRTKLEALTDRTITDKEVLKERLRQVRAQGYVVVSEELELGLRAISVLVEGRSPTRLALNISAQAARVSEAQMIEAYLPPLRRAARQIQLSIQQ
ncbi:IclR family transcriptional regulator domain-containing protein [Microvirga sp. 2TAF3]|uniref:IclR family transcriptional regulator domain-containing protein n=1 Tax=Microvirga sp. 2TAF3 TaxID=3233014 RepID=UPI003F96B6A3